MATAAGSTRTCAKCFKPLGETAVSAMSAHWHPECWTCSHCKKPFPNGKYVVFKERPYCKNDYDWLCAVCGAVIEDDYVRRNSELTHVACLRCQVCRKVVGNAHKMLNDKVLCDEDYELEKKASRHYSEPAADHGTCAACHKPIHFTPLRAEGAVYHDYCFACAYCKNTIRGAYNKHQGFPICAQCENFVCGVCQKVIDGEFVTVEGKKVHSSGCFLCSFCQTPLNPKQYQKRQGKPVCAACAAAKA